MSIIEGLIVSLFCIVLVFFVLSCLFALIKVLSKALSGIGGKKATVETAAAKSDGEENSNGISTGELKLIHVDEKTAAMIMAIVSHESEIPLSELSFKSIKALES